MRSRSHRLLTVLILLGWIVPQSTALAWSLHLGLDGHEELHHLAGPGHSHPPGQDHHHPHTYDSEPACDHLAHRVGLAALVETLAHGHSHEDSEAAPDHEHEAPANGAKTIAHGQVLTCSLGPEPLQPPSAEAAELDGDRALRSGPPPPLFTTHCSLLL